MNRTVLFKTADGLSAVDEIELPTPPPVKMCRVVRYSDRKMYLCPHCGQNTVYLHRQYKRDGVAADVAVYREVVK